MTCLGENKITRRFDTYRESFFIVSNLQYYSDKAATVLERKNGTVFYAFQIVFLRFRLEYRKHG